MPASRNELFARIVDEFRPVSLALGYVSGVLTGGLVSLAGYLLQADRFTFLSVGAIVALLSVIVLNFVRNRPLGRITVAAIVVASCAFILWAVYDKHQQAENYDLDRARTLLLRDEAKRQPDGRLAIGHLRWRVDFQNNNDFPVWFVITRQYGRVEDNATALDPEENQEQPLELKKGQGSSCISDEIPRATVYVGDPYHHGEISCIVKFGRDKQHLDKTFDWTRKVQFLICPYANKICDMSYY